jgi:hypothetical protein
MILHLGVVVGGFFKSFKIFIVLLLAFFHNSFLYLQSYSILFTHVTNFNNPIEAQIVGPQHFAQHTLV